MIYDRRGMKCMHMLVTFLLLSLCLLTSGNGNGGHTAIEGASNTQATMVFLNQYQLVEKRKRLLEEDHTSILPHNNRKLGFSLKKKKKKKKHGKKSAANHSGMSISHATSIFCVSLLLAFVFI